MTAMLASSIDVAGIQMAPRVAARLADPTLQTWIELRFAREPLSIADILFAVRTRCEASVRTVVVAVDSWTRQGWIEQHGRPAIYTMVAFARHHANPPPLAAVPRAPRPIAPRSPRQRLWTAMRVLKRFDLVTITMAADVSERTALDFLRTMTRASYLRSVVLPTAAGTTWVQGARPWGPLPPTIRHLRIASGTILRVTDRNDGVSIDLPLRAHRPERSAGADDLGGEG